MHIYIYICIYIDKYIFTRKPFYSCEENFFIDAKKFFLYLQENIFIVVKNFFFIVVRKTLFKNVLCAFFIGFCSDGSFLWIQNY